MITRIFKYGLPIVLLFTSAWVQAQERTGRIEDKEGKGISFANIDVYTGDERVASVLSNSTGEFTLRLDSGSYSLKVQRFGYVAATVTFTIPGRGKLRVQLDADVKALKEAEESRVEYDRAPSRDAMGTTYLLSSETVVSRDDMYKAEVRRPMAPGMEGMPHEDRQPAAGMLTAGEVNDFAKWAQWTDLDTGELREYRTFWTFFVQERYMVEVMDQRGLPLADLRVDLLDGNGIVIFTARTDNTGKAELWAQVGLEQKRRPNRILVTHNGKQHSLRSIHSIGEGTNRLEVTSDCNQSQVVDISFVVDATGSMGDELEFLKMELNDVIFQSKQMSDLLDLRFGHVFYRDKGDEYLTRHMDFSRVLSEATEFIRHQYAAGGGDAPEAVEEALDVAINKLSWSDNARARLLFLVLDAPPHGDDSIKQRMIKLAREAAAKGIRIIPVTGSGIDKSTEYLMRSLALTTNGTYTFLTDHSGIGGTHIEPSTDEYEVESLNALLVRLIQSFTYMPDCSQQLPQLELDYPDSLVLIPDSSVQGVDSTQAIDNGGGHDLPVLSWKFYPNPTRGPFTITANHEVPELHITDLSGKLLMVVRNLQTDELRQVDLTGYPSGIYLLRYPKGDRMFSGKLVLFR